MRLDDSVAILKKTGELLRLKDKLITKNRNKDLVDESSRNRCKCGSCYIRESELDSFQLLVLQRKVDKPTLVKGSAGSGKSIIALHRVKQIQEQNIGSFYFIVRSKDYKRFLKCCIDALNINNSKFLYYKEWEKINFPSADFIIVDEIQDFSEQDIRLFQSKANKALIMFGDRAQQLDAFRQDNPPISVEDIAVLTRIPTIDLSFEHRLPKKIARLAEFISDSDDDLEHRCLNEGVEYPKILQFNNLHEQFDKIIEIINSRRFEDVGIFFQTEQEVIDAKNYFDSKVFNVEAKY